MGIEEKYFTPIVIGVSAHRDIPTRCKNRIKARVKEFIADLQTRFPSTPIIMLNSVAEGGDMLCAEAAIECGVALHIVLPMPREEFANCFSAEGKSKFQEIEKYDMAMEYLAADIEEATILSADTQNYLYRQQAINMAIRSHILLALWDGEDSFDKSKFAYDTSAAINFALRHAYGTSEEISDTHGVVAWIFSPREGKSYSEEDDDITYLTIDENNELVRSKDLPEGISKMMNLIDICNLKQKGE